MKTSPEDSKLSFNSAAYPQYNNLDQTHRRITTHTTPSGTGSTVMPSIAYPHIDWPQYNPELEPFAPTKVTGPKFTSTHAQQQQQQQQLQDMSTAVKHDQNKADWSLMPWEAVEEINKVLAFGAKKYAAHNWQQGTGFKYTRVLNSLLRHVFAYMRGEDNDPESGLSHMAHAGCNVLFILHYIKNKSRYKNDDRYVP